jgi:hypothetical protein
MRSAIRPALVGLAVVGMSFAGAASASACSNDDAPSSVKVTNIEADIEDSFNEFNFTQSFNGTLIDGDVTIN